MRHSISTRLLLAIIIAASSAARCASNVEAADRGLDEPVVMVRQPAGQMLLRPGGTNDLNLQVDIYNPSSEQIIVKRVSLSTLPTGALQFQVSRNVDETIEPKTGTTVELWARASNPIGQVNATEPVQVRGTAVFDSASGTFRKVFTEYVVESSRGWPEEQ